MKIRSIFVCTLALAAIAGAIVSGITFATFEATDAPTAWLFNLVACALVFALGFAISGGTYSIAFLLVILALCLPAAGPALAALIALSIHFMRPAREEEELFKIGNPLCTRGSTAEPGAVLGRPLVDALRSLSYLNLFRLLTGIGCLPPKDARPVLLRLRSSDDAQLQLFAQGNLNDAIETSEKHLSNLARHARSRPGDAATHCAIAEIHLHLLDNNLVEEDDRPAAWDAATRAISSALKAAPNDALGLKICARLNLIGGDPQKAKLVAESLAKISGHADIAKLLLAEATFEVGEFESVESELRGVTPGASRRDDILDFWRKPKPNAYA
jgi:hypothetical protein